MGKKSSTLSFTVIRPSVRKSTYICVRLNSVPTYRNDSKFDMQPYHYELYRVCHLHGCGVAVKEIIQYLRIRETRRLQNTLKWSEIKSFSGTNIKNFARGLCPLNPLVLWASIGGPETPASFAFRPYSFGPVWIQWKKLKCISDFSRVFEF